MVRHYLKIVRSSKSGNLKGLLDKTMKTEESNKGEITQLKKEIKRLEYDGSFHIQKLGLVRFNPFAETGGDQSFCMALLDGRDTGIVITGLHTRIRTRIYMKKIVNAKSEHALSAEEKKAIVQAK